MTESEIHFPANDCYAKDEGFYYHSYENADNWESVGIILFIDGHVKFGIKYGFWRSDEDTPKH